MQKNGILLTGGLGFIGSTVARKLLENFPDRKLILLDSMTYAGNPENMCPEMKSLPSDRFEFVCGDISDRKTVSRVMKGCSQVVHMAAESHVSNSLAQADEFVQANIVGCMVLGEEALKARIERFIHISTSEVYGTAMLTPMDVSHPLNPRSPYAATKAGGELFLKSLHYSYHLPLTILRPFNNYGPRQHTEKVIPCFISRLLRQEPIHIMDGGNQTRDWLYVEDTAEAICSALKCELSKILCRTINLGTGREISISEIADILIELTHSPKELKRMEGHRPGQVFSHHSSTHEAEEALGWKARIPFEDGIKRTVDWYKDNQSWCENLSVASYTVF